MTPSPEPESDKKTQRKRYLLVAALVAVVLVFALVERFQAAQVDANGNVTKAGNLGVFSLRKGQCFDEPAAGQDVSSIKAIPCSQPHDAQVTGSITLTETSYDQNALDTDAEQQCATAAQAAVNPTYLSSSTGVTYLIPDDTAWGKGNRTATCAVDNSATQLTGSILN